MLSDRRLLSPQVLCASGTYLSFLPPSSRRRVAPRSLPPAGPGAPALRPAGPGGPGRAQQGPESSRAGRREHPLHHQTHEPLPVGRPAPGPEPQGLLPLLTWLWRLRHGRGGRWTGCLLCPPGRDSAGARPVGPRSPLPRGPRALGCGPGHREKELAWGPAPEPEATFCPEAISGSAGPALPTSG